MLHELLLGAVLQAEQVVHVLPHGLIREPGFAWAVLAPGSQELFGLLFSQNWGGPSAQQVRGVKVSIRFLMASARLLANPDSGCVRTRSAFSPASVPPASRESGSCARRRQGERAAGGLAPGTAPPPSARKGPRSERGGGQGRRGLTIERGRGAARLVGGREGGLSGAALARSGWMPLWASPRGVRSPS